MNLNAPSQVSPDPSPDADPQESTTEPWSEEPWKEMSRLAEAGNADDLLGLIAKLSSVECTHALSHLDEEDAERVLALLPADEAAELIRHLPESQAALTIAALQADKAAAIVLELPSDEQADVLGDLEEEQAEAILNSLPTEEAASVRELTAYEDDVAGGLMVSELMRFTDDMTVANVITQLSEDQEKYDDFDIRYGYVCDRNGALIGVLPMSQLLFEKRSRPIAAIMIRQPL